MYSLQVYSEETYATNKQGDFLNCFNVLFSTLIHLPPFRLHCVGGCWHATSVLCVRPSNHSAIDLIHSRVDFIRNSARSYPALGQISSTTRLDLIHHAARSHPFSARSHPQLGQVLSSTRLDLIHNSARSHPLLGQISSTARLDHIHISARSYPPLCQISPQLG